MIFTVGIASYTELSQFINWADEREIIYEVDQSTLADGYSGPIIVNGSIPLGVEGILDRPWIKE